MDRVRLEDVAKPVAQFKEFLESCPEERKPTVTAWQQNIRSMNHHRQTLERVIVLPSEESLKQLSEFKTYAGRLFSVTNPNLSIESVESSDDSEDSFFIFDGQERIRSYENYDYVRDGLERAVKQAMRKTASRKAVRQQDICIDATAGQKTFSIAAAIITLNSKLVFSYVTTKTDGERKGGEVRFYDAAVDVSFMP